MSTTDVQTAGNAAEEVTLPGSNVPWSLITKVFVAVAAVALLVIIMQQRSEAEQRRAWVAYGDAEREGLTVEALETAYAEAADTAAGAWVGFRLALASMEVGTVEALDRAAQVAREVIEQHPGHPAAEAAAPLRDAIEEQLAFLEG